MKSMRYWKPLVCAKVLRMLSRFFAAGAAESVSSRRSTTTGSAAISFGPADSAASPRVCRAGMPALGERAELLGRLAEPGGGDARRPRRGACPRRRSRAGPSWWRGPGGGSRGTSRAGPRGRRRARRWPGRRSAALAKKPVTCSRFSGERLEDRVAVGGEAGELVVLVGEDLEDAVGLAQGGVGAVDDGAEVVAAGGEAGAEVVEDEPEAVAVGGAVDVLDQVEVDGLAVVLERQQALALPRSRPRSARARGAAPRRARGAGSGCSRRSFSPISDCGRMMQEASSRKSLKASSSMFMTTTALPGTACGPPSRLAISSSSGDVDGLDGADGGAGDRGPPRR